jgi:hypothetical protein
MVSRIVDADSGDDFDDGDYEFPDELLEDEGACDDDFLSYGENEPAAASVSTHSPWKRAAEPGASEQRLYEAKEAGKGLFEVADMVERRTLLALVKPVSELVAEGVISSLLARAWFLDCEQDALVVVCTEPSLLESARMPNLRCFLRKTSVSHIEPILASPSAAGRFFAFPEKLDSFAFSWTLEDAVRSEGESGRVRTARDAIIFATQRLREAHDYCCICHGRIHYLEQAFRPTCCEKALCSFKLTEYGFSTLLEREILNNPEVTDLIISLAYVAAQTPSQDPKLRVSPRFENVQIKEMLDKVPSLAEMAAWVRANPNKKLSGLLPLEHYNALMHIMSLNRAFITSMAPEHRLTNIPGFTQLSFHFSSPKSEVAFREFKDRAAASLPKSSPASLFAFHGSSAQNWFHIITKGFNHDRIVHGRVYGDGVYFGYQLETSLAYVRAAPNWPRSIYGRSLEIVSVNEIVNNPASFVSTSPFLVVKENSAIQPRFLLIRNSELPVDAPTQGKPDTVTAKEEFFPANPSPLLPLSYSTNLVAIPTTALLDIKSTPKDMKANTKAGRT